MELTGADRRSLRALDFRGVELGEGPHRRQLDEVRATFAELSDDSLLYPFRIRRGRAAPGTPLRGWYGEGLFNNLGQFLTLYARLFAATGDERFAAKARHVLEGWAETIDENGYFLNATGASCKEYSYDKLVCGLLDIHEYVGHDQALPVLRRISEWMDRYGDRSRPYAWNGMGPLEWYTLSEYLLRAFTITADPLYLQLADRYRYDEFYDLLLRGGLSDLMDRAHELHRFYQAHSHVNALNGAAARYQVTGERGYLDAAIAGYDLVRSTQVYATGMFGPLEAFVTPWQLSEVLHSEVGHAEISCPTWAMMRLVRHLIELTGEARYGDWIEQTVYNGVGAAPPTRADGRALQYFADYGLAGARKTWGPEWSCCSTTNPISIAEYVDQIYYATSDALHVCLFLPSEVTVPFAGRRLRLVQCTAFPASEDVEFEVSLDGPADGVIAVREPGWLAGPMAVHVNGQPVRPERDLGWLRLRRSWRDGDRIGVTMPARLEVLPVEPGYPGPVALRHGPVVMVVREDDHARRLSHDDIASVVRTARRHQDGTLEITGSAADGSEVRLVPYAAVPPEAPYAMHFDDDDPGRVGHTDLGFSTTSDWRQVDIQEFTLTRRRRYAASEAAGAWFACGFEGTAVVWAGYRSPIAGYADVYIDGELIERVTQFGPSPLPAFLWRRTGLAPGSHELRVEVVGDAPEASRGTEVNVKHVRGVDT